MYICIYIFQVAMFLKTGVYIYIYIHIPRRFVIAQMITVTRVISISRLILEIN